MAELNPLISFREARDLLLRSVSPAGLERLPLEACAFRVLARDVTAPRDLPAFGRSAMDGYAVRSGDLTGMSGEVSLRIIGQLRAGDDPGLLTLVSGTAVGITTGAPLPAGADAVVMAEHTAAADSWVRLNSSVRPGENVIPAGEDLRRGSTAVRSGTEIDPGLLGLLAALGMAEAEVYRLPRVGILSTGTELAQIGRELRPGTVYDANRYLLAASLRRLGCESRFLGCVGDDEEEIARIIGAASAEAMDALIITGGVSAGRWDLTPAAMELAGAKILFRGVDMKPGKSCAYGLLDGMLICALSGNPAAALTNLHAVAAPALRRLRGLRECLPREIRLTLAAPFPKESRRTRLLRGRLDLSDGTALFRFSVSQGNAVLSSTVGCDAVAVIPAGSGALPAGTVLEGFLLETGR